MTTFGEAFLNTLMGMGTVFVVLIFISLIISLFVYVPKLEDKFKSFKARIFMKNVPKRKETLEHAESTKEEVYEDEIEDEALIAVIMAAIVASEGGAVSADTLVVRSIRRVKRRS